MSSDLADNKLFAPLQVGNATLDHRVVLAPLTRVRANEDLCPTELHVEYYKQRASKGGLLITEATIIAPQSIPSRHIPGIFNEQQALAWKKVTDAVHEKGGLISIQLWHQGRIAHDSYTEHPLAKANNAIVCEGASPIAGEHTQPTYRGNYAPLNPPRQMTIDDIKRVQQQFLQGAKFALEVANFDFVEIHGAHGYLLDQFVTDGTNKRDDEYGGSVENRAKFLLEVVDLLSKQYPQRTAVRISPHTDAPSSRFWGSGDSNPDVTYSYVINQLAKVNELAYILVTEPTNIFGDTDANAKSFKPNSSRLITNFYTENKNTKLISAGGYAPKAAYDVMALDKPYHDAIGFGRWFISNPDLPFRLRYGLPLNKYNRQTFYVLPHLTGEKDADGEDVYKYNLDEFAVGYIDYPTFEEVVHAKFGADVDVFDVIANKEKIAELIAATQNDQYPLVTLDDIGYSVNSSQRKRI